MSDLLSPILFLMENEVEAFWCFVGFMEKLVRYLHSQKAHSHKYARMFVRGYYLFWEANSSEIEAWGTDNVQGQISKHIFAPNEGFCVYHRSNLFRNTRSFENWGIFNIYSPKWRWLAVDIYWAAKRRGKYPPLATDTEVNSCFSIY